MTTKITRQQMVEWLDAEAMPLKASQPPPRKLLMLQAIRAALAERRGLTEALITELAERRVIAIRAYSDGPTYDHYVKQEVLEIKAAIAAARREGV